VKVYPDTEDNRDAHLTVKCNQGLSCSAEEQSVNLTAPSLKPFTATLVEDLNSGEIDAELRIAHEPALVAPKSLDFGFWKSLAKFRGALDATTVGEIVPVLVRLWRKTRPLQPEGGLLLCGEDLRPSPPVHSHFVAQ
jgi:hypothetical protein